MKDETETRRGEDATVLYEAGSKWVGLGQGVSSALVLSTRMNLVFARSLGADEALCGG